MAPPVANVIAPEKAPKLHAGVTVREPSVLTAMLQAGMTVMEPGVPPASMQEGVTVNEPTVPVTVHGVVQSALALIWKVPAPGAHANAPLLASRVGLVIVPQAVMVRADVPNTKVRGANWVIVPTGAEKVLVVMPVTVTGAAKVVTWKLPAAGLIAYKAVVPNNAAVVGHADAPPPVADVTDVGTVNKTRWYAASVPTAAAITLAVVPRAVTAIGAEEVVTIKELADGTMAYRSAEAKDAALVGQTVGVMPEPLIAVGEGAVKETTCPALRVPTAALIMLSVIPVTEIPVGKVDTLKLSRVGAAAYRVAPTIAAALAGHAIVPPPPESVVVLPVCVKKRRVPAASVPTGAYNELDVIPVILIPVTPVATTQ